MTTAAMMKAYDMSSNTTVSVADKATFSVVMMKSHDQYNLYFDTRFDTAIASAMCVSLSYYTNPSYFAIHNANYSSTTSSNGAPYDFVIDSESSIVIDIESSTFSNTNHKAPSLLLLISNPYFDTISC